MLDRALGLGVMARPGGELAVAERAQLAAQRLPGDANPELLPYPLEQDEPVSRKMANARRPLEEHSGVLSK